MDFSLAPAAHTDVESMFAVELDDGNLMAAWFAGTFEGKKDVAIYTSVFDRATGHWSPQPQEVVKPHGKALRTSVRIVPPQESPVEATLTLPSPTPAARRRR
eukprot:scaffold2501_cov423-Prasinococcus_capsulatus_cf.AAC.9